MAIPVEPEDKTPVPEEAPKPQHWAAPFENPGRMRIGGGWAKSPDKFFEDAKVYSGRVRKIESYPTNDYDISQDAWKGQLYNDKRGFWENPKNVIKYKQLSDAGIAPTWVDRNVVDNAYSYFSIKNANLPQSKWDYLKEDDPASEILRQMPAPVHPSKFLQVQKNNTTVYELPEDETIALMTELAEASSNPVLAGTFNNLGWAQKAQQYLMNRGTPAGMDTKQSSAHTYTSNIMPAGMMGIMTMAFTHSMPAALVVTGLVYAMEVDRTRNLKHPRELMPTDNLDKLPSIYQDIIDAQKTDPFLTSYDLALPMQNAMTQERWDRIPDKKKLQLINQYNQKIEKANKGETVGLYDQAMNAIGKVFNIPSQGVETTIGMITTVMKDRDIGTILEFYGKEYSKDLRKAMELTYDAGVTGNILGDITGTLSGKGYTKKGEVWQTYLGVAEPVKPDFKTGGDALQDMANRIIAGEDANMVMAEYAEKFGDEGLMNDFVYQSLFDPLNYAGVVGAKGAEMTGKISGNKALEMAGRTAGWDFKNPKTVGRMVADIIPGASVVLPLATGGRVQPSTGLLGALNAYKAFLHTDVMNGKIAPSELTKAQKIIAGLTDDGRLKVFEPSNLELLNEKPNILKNPIKYFKYLTELTAVSKAFMFGYHTQDAIVSLFEMSDYNIHSMKAILDAAAQADGTLTQTQIAALLDPLEKQQIITDPRYFNSPIAASVHDGIKYFVANHLDDYINMFDAVSENRKTLTTLSEIYDLRQDQVIHLAKNGADFGARAKTIQDPARRMTLDKLIADNKIQDLNVYVKSELAPFTKQGAPALWSEQLFGRGVAQHFGNTMGEWIAGRYGITADPTLYRLSGMLKSAQSILLLGWNPRYFINNEINNIVTRVATGVFGYTPKLQAEIDAHRIDLMRGDIIANVVSQGSDAGDSSFMKGVGNRNNKAELKWIEKASRTFKDINNKVGIFSKLSGKVEAMESSQTTFIAYRDMRERLFVPQIPDDIRIELNNIDPNLAGRIEFAVRSGRNMDEVMHNIQGEHIIPEEFISSVAKDYSSAHQSSLQSEDIYTSLANKTGITDALNEGLGKLKDPTEMDVIRVVDDVEKNLIKNVTKLNQESLDAKIEDIKIRTNRQSATNDFTEIGRIYEEMTLQQQLDKFNHMFELDTTYEQKVVLTRVEFEELLQKTLSREDIRFEDANTRNKASYNAILEALGEKSDSPHAKAITDALDTSLKNNKKFNDKKDAIYKKYLSDVKGKTDAEAAVMLAQSRAEVEGLWNSLQVEQEKLNMTVDNALFVSLGNEPTVIQWRNDIATMRKNLTRMMNEFRAGLNNIDTGAHNSVERRAAWNRFFMEEYFPAYVKMGYADVDGAQKIFNARNEVIDYFIRTLDTDKHGKLLDAESVKRTMGTRYGLVDAEGKVIVPDEPIENVFNVEEFINSLYDEAVRQANDPDFTRTPPNSVPEPTPQAEAARETVYQHVLPFLDSVREKLITSYRNSSTKFKDIPPELQARVNNWARGLQNDFTTSKYAALKYAQMMRDLTMLNYQQKTNLDEALNLYAPYQFWYTHTMRNWLLRTVDKASWYNMYFRWREMQEKLDKDGLPNRLRGKIAAPFAFMDEWMGNTVWFDPFVQTLPFVQMFQPIENFANKGANIEHNAIGKVWDMVSNNEITREQADNAINTKSGSIWESAYAAASSEEDKDPLTLASLMLSPAMWWDVGLKLIRGKQDEIALTPGARASQALQAQADETWGKGSAVGAALGGLSWLETNLRKAVGMSPAVARYGQFGDYYIERELSNMAFDGRASVYDAIDAMLTREGELYEQADHNVARALSLRTPGMLGIEALRGDQNAIETIGAFFLTLFPLGLLPQGEMKYKGIQQEFNNAWEVYEQTGDKTKVIELYNQYPEMAARTALYEKDPEKRMKQYIIGKIGDVYYSAPKANQLAIQNALGEDFKDAFVNRETMKPDMLSLETLMTYARILNVVYPQNSTDVVMPPQPEVESVSLYSEETALAYQRYVNTRSALFPLWYYQQKEYYDQKNSGKNPEIPEMLQKYWDWNADYIKKHPEISPIIESGKTIERTKYEGVSLKSLDPILLKQLSNYYTTGETLSAGAWELLYETWSDLGKPQGDFHRWMTREIQPAITGVEPEKESGYSLLTEEQKKIYSEYAAEKDKLFPLIREVLDLYYATENYATRKKVVKEYPILNKYWDWEKEYKVKVPEITGIKEVVSSPYKD